MAVNFERIRRNFNGRFEEPVRKHLRDVYACTAMASVSAATGTYLHIYTRLMSAGWLSLMASFGLFMALQCTPPSKTNNKLRLGYLLGSALFIGVGIGPLVNYAIEIDPSLIVTALIGTAVIFCCFTLSALFSPRGYWLFLLGPSTAVLSTLLLLSVANLFFASSWLYQANLYIGLLVMCGLVLYDTNAIIEKRRMGDTDFIHHSLDIFLDLVSIFKKLLAILVEKERNAKSRSKNK